MLSYPVSQATEASAAAVGVGARTLHISRVNVLVQGIKACGGDSCFRLPDSPFCIELVVAGH